MGIQFLILAYTIAMLYRQVGRQVGIYWNRKYKYIKPEIKYFLTMF